MTLSERMLGLVVEPTSGRTPPRFAPPAPAPPEPARVAVLAQAGDASAAAAAVALALSRRSRRSCALAVCWGAMGEDPPPAGALPAATRLASRLRRCGVNAVAAGQLVRVGVAGDAGDAIASWRIVCREEVPAAFALAGPRNDAIDNELASMEAIVVAVARDAPAGLVAAAESDAARIGPAVATTEMRLGAATRGLLTLGYGVPPRIRSAIDEVLG